MRKGRITSSHYGFYVLGYTRATSEITKTEANIITLQSRKNFHSADHQLQFVDVKEESRVIVNQKVTVKLYLSLVQTARHAPKFSITGKYSTVYFIKSNLYNKRKL